MICIHLEGQSIVADTKQLYGNLEIDKEVDNKIAVALFQFERYATNRYS